MMKRIWCVLVVKGYGGDGVMKRMGYGDERLVKMVLGLVMIVL